MDYFNYITLNKNSKDPMYQQLADSIHKLIFEGKLPPNYKLPPIRILSKKFNVNNSTIVNAYKYLENKKLVYCQMGSGTYVSPLPIVDSPEPSINLQITTFNKRNKYTLENALNFATTSTSENLFPVDEFKQIFNEVLDRDKGLAFNYQESQGFPPLRMAICSYLSHYGIKSNFDKIQIISGAQQGIDIISKAILKSNDIVFVEKPTYYGAIGAFASRGAELIEIPLEKDGMDIALLESYMKLYSPKFIYIMTYYQTPTSISYSLEKKRKLLHIADQYDTYIIEEDNLSDFNYTNKPNIPLKALDYKNRVIYIKSFSKILMPGLRLGFMVLPQKILKQVNLAKHTTDISTSGFIQRALELYLQKNLWLEHTQYVCNIYKKRYDEMIKCINLYLKEYVEYNPPHGGLTIWLKLKKDININDLCNQLLAENIIVSPGNLYCLSQENMPYIRLSFASVKKDDISNGIQMIQRILKASKKD